MYHNLAKTGKVRNQVNFFCLKTRIKVKLECLETKNNQHGFQIFTDQFKTFCKLKIANMIFRFIELNLFF